MKKFIMKSIALLLVAVFVLSGASLALSAVTYVTGSNPVSASYKSGKYYTQLSQIPKTGNQRQDVLAVAFSQLGYQEGDSDGQFSGTVSGSDNYTEFNYNFGNWGSGYGGSAYPWCACFATWVLRQSGVNTIGTGMSNAARNHTTESNYIWCEISCDQWYNQLERFGHAKTSAARGGNYTPQPADMIFFSSNGTKSTHTGFVVYSDGTNVYTIEGNTSSSAGLETNGGGVYFKSYALTSDRIWGYGAMPYTTGSSNIDYSGANPTTGIYMAASGAKWLYKDAANVGTSNYDMTLPAYSMFAVTEVVSQSVLKCTVNGATYYIANDSDRIVQITKSSGNISGNTTVGINAAMFIDAINGTKAGESVTGSTINGAPRVQTPVQPSTTTMTFDGWAVVSNGQPASSLHYSFDYGASWIQATGDNYYATEAAEAENFANICGGYSISNFQSANARFKNIAISLAGKEGQTVNVTLGVKGNDGGIYPCVTLSGVEVPGGSSGGDSGGGTTTTNDKAVAAIVNFINGVGPDGTAGTNYASDLVTINSSVASANIPKALTDPFLYVSGWCMTNNGQKDEFKFSLDGGVTWAGICSVSSVTNGVQDHINAASGLAGMPNPNASHANFNSLCANLTQWGGQTVNVTFGRTSSWGETVPFVTVTGVAVPKTQSSTANPNAFPEPTVVFQNSRSYAWAYVANIDFINGTGDPNNNNKAWGLSGYRDSTKFKAADQLTDAAEKAAAKAAAITPATVTGIQVMSGNTVSIQGWAQVRMGILKYVWSVDGYNWYDCTGRVANISDAEFPNIQGAVSADPREVLGGTQANGRFYDLTADLSHWQGQTIDVMFGVVSSYAGYSDRALHFLTIQGVSVPAHVCSSSSSATCMSDKVCDTCGATMESALGHAPGSVATCESDQICTRCSTVLVGKFGHKPGEAATCTADQKCMTCGKVLANKLNHAPGAAATCTTAQTCTRCGETIQAALGHEPGPAATCTSSQKCTRCDYVYETSAGHTPGPAATCTTDQICTVCKIVLEAHTGHVADAQVSCTDISYCTKCGEKIRDAKGHTEVVIPGTEPTCTQSGYTEGKKCSECGTIIKKQETIPAKDHTPGPAATCTTDQICTVCNEVLVAHKGHTPGAEASCSAPQICIVCEIELAPQKTHTPGAEATCTEAQICTACRTVLVKALGHTEQVTPGTPATCLTTGMSDLIVCTTCDKVLQAQEVINALGHIAGPAATCTEDQVCTREGCDHVFVKATGHNEVNIQSKEPTCTEDGNGVGKRCTICQEITEQPEVIPKLGHIEGPAATCTTPQICERCTEVIVSALGHTAETIPAVTPTCTGTGLSEGQKCSVCDIVTIPQSIIPARGHTYDNEEDAECNVCGYIRAIGCQHEYDNACDVDCNLCGEIRVAAEHQLMTLSGKAATCTESGLTEGKQCTVCYKVTVPQTTIKALKHNYKTTVVKATCSTRGYTSYECQNDGCNSAYKSNYIPAIGHDYTEKQFSATCIAGSYTLYTCKNCEDSYKNGYISAGGHTYTTTVIAPTCTARGYTIYTCNCGMTYRDNYTSAKGHVYTQTTVTATCTTRGYTSLSCTGCSLVYKTDYVTATGHSYTAQTTAPTCTTRGYTTYTCTCGATYKANFVDATGHNYNSVTQAPTATDVGYTQHTCQNAGCGKSYIDNIIAPNG